MKMPCNNPEAAQIAPAASHILQLNFSSLETDHVLNLLGSPCTRSEVTAHRKPHEARNGVFETFN